MFQFLSSKRRVLNLHTDNGKYLTVKHFDNSTVANVFQQWALMQAVMKL